MGFTKSIMAIALMMALAAAAGAHDSAAPGAKLPRILILTGSGNTGAYKDLYPPWVHEYQNEKVAEILQGIAEVEISDDLQVLNSKHLKKYDLIISNSLFLSPNKKQLAALKEFITNGKALLTLHSGLLSFLNADFYEDMMGGIFIGGPSTEPETFKVVTENMEFWGYECCVIAPCRMAARKLCLT